jgi:ribonucleoside-diphosphate reductase alpha chain
MTTAIAPISQQIWDMKYRLKNPDGSAVDQTVEDTWTRVATALAQAESEPAHWAEEFYSALADFRFLPAGRIVAGAGTARQVTLFNCFVMGTIPDDMSGIFEHLREAAVTLQQGGGIGYDFSTLRPKGAPVKGVGADASGPLSFMDVWDAMCRTIMSAGQRRGAMMATLRCDHPDIEAFIDAKREPGRLRNFNLSVLVTDPFMAAVEQDGDWELTFGGVTYRTVRARDLWDRIMKATFAYAEPGVIFIDRINRRNNLHYCESIQATNPCIVEDSWVHTAEGPRQVADLVGKRFVARLDGQDHPSGEEGFFATGTKPVLKLQTREGATLILTHDHPVLTAASVSRSSIERKWVPAGDLQPGDRVMLNDHRAQPSWPGSHGEDEGYLIGLLVGDGTLKADRAILSVWLEPSVVNGSAAAPQSGVMNAAFEAMAALKHRSDWKGWMPVAGRAEHRMASTGLRDLAFDLGLRPGRKAVTPAIEQASSAFYIGFLRGFFDADGTVLGDQKKGVSLRLAQSDLDRLSAVQRMLLRLGIVSTIYRERRSSGMRMLPDGRGGSASYHCAADHELVITGENLAVYADRIGFADRHKQARLAQALAGYRRRQNRERFVAIVDSLEPAGTRTVYDVRVPGVNAFDANGLVVHNCGEQPLPPYGACLLGSINLARLVTEPFTPKAALDVTELDRLVRVAIRALDDAIDVSRFPLEAQAVEARAKRRIGLGITGLGDALIMMRARYGSDEGVTLTERWMATFRRAAYLASVDLAKEKGAFPLFDKAEYMAGETIRELDADVQAAIAEYGIRNALLTSIAPTGTISLMADNVSSGLEPVFGFQYTRNVLMADGTRKQEEVSDYAYRLFRRLHGDDIGLPDYFVDAQTLTPHDHVVMQAVVQKYIDSSISKTINVPADIDFESFRQVYLEAYKFGCKGCTTYRPNDITGAVLEVSKPAPAPATGDVVYMTQPLQRPETLQGQTYKIRWPDSDHAMYITLNDMIQDGRRRPFEIFINSKNMDHYAWTVALTRMISAVFRRGGDISFVVEELKAVFDPRGGQWMGGHYVPSLLAAIGDVIERHLIQIGMLPAKDGDEPVETRQVVNLSEPGGQRLRACPKCHQPSLVRQEGCDACTSCGYSKCS